jgi:hypothetical protein
VFNLPCNYLQPMDVHTAGTKHVLQRNVWQLMQPCKQQLHRTGTCACVGPHPWEAMPWRLIMGMRAHNMDLRKTGCIRLLLVGSLVLSS